MEYVSVTEAAGILGLSRSRVMHLVKSGQLDAERAGPQWLVHRGSLPLRQRRAGRPMSERVAWGLVLLSQGERAPWLRSDEMYRLRTKWEGLKSETDPVLTVQSWLAGRADSHHLSAPDSVGLRADPRLVLSGWSDPRSRMASARDVEGYVHSDDVDAVMRDHLLVPVPRHRADAVVHVTVFQPADPVPLLLLIADLADHLGARERNRAVELLHELLPGRSTTCAGS